MLRKFVLAMTFAAGLCFVGSHAMAQDATDYTKDEQKCEASMPGLDGFAVCRALGRLPAPARPPIVLMTGHDSLTVRREGIRHGACEFLAKPVTPEALLARVRRQLHVAALGRGLARLERRLDRAADGGSRFQFNVDVPPAMRWHCDGSITKLKISARHPVANGDPEGVVMPRRPSRRPVGQLPGERHGAIEHRPSRTAGRS